MFKGKRGQGLSTNAIVLIVLAVIVLVVLILGFTIGWNKLAPWISSGTNVDQVSTSCSVACSTGASFDFCSQNRTLTVEGEDVATDVTCFELSGTQYAQYGIDECPEIEC